jgi:hypothetical protein
MRSNDSAAFKTNLAEVYNLYRAELTVGVLELWWGALKPYNLSDVKSALAKHVANGEIGQFCPKPADVIKTIEDSAKATGTMCTHCGADLARTGFTAMMGGICNPCYKAYLNNEWTSGRAA